MTKVSIIIPMYNEERYIGRCLESLKEQTFKDFEVILIDDGSKDNTIKLAESFNKDFQLRILKQKHGGPGKARNRGAKEAKGDIFVFVDADMYFDKNYIKHLIQPILDGNEVGTAHGVEFVGNIENILAKTWSLNRIPMKESRSNVYRAIEKEAFFNSGGYNDDKYAFEDNIGSKSGISALVVNEAICYHNNPTNLKEVFNHDAWIGESLIAKKIYKEYLIKYKEPLLILISLLVIIVLISIIFKVRFSIIILALLISIILFIEILALKKIKQDRKTIKKFKLNKGKTELNYLWSLLILMATRFCGYIYGILKFLFSKK